MAERSKIYFASDFHLGLPAGTEPLEREKKIVRWIDTILPDAREIFLLGDIFDFWWEYRKVVPKGFTRFLGKIASVTDSGIPVHFFTGNHDMWVGDYLTKECGMLIHTKPYTVIIDGKKFHLAHGEGLGSRHRGYKILLWIFRNKPLRMLWSAIHPATGVAIGHIWSLNSRLGKGISPAFMGADREDLIRYARSVAEKEKMDYYVFGHRHLAMTYTLEDGGEMVMLGDWITHSSYAEWDGNSLVLRMFS